MKHPPGLLFISLHYFKKDACVFYDNHITVRYLQEKFSLGSPESSNNVYMLWDIQAPDGFAVSISIQQNEIPFRRHDLTNLYFGDNTTVFSDDLTSCIGWTRLTGDDGRILTKYMKFTSRSTAAKLILSSLALGSGFDISLEAIKIHSKS